VARRTLPFGTPPRILVARVRIAGGDSISAAKTTHFDALRDGFAIRIPATGMEVFLLFFSLSLSLFAWSPLFVVFCLQCFPWTVSYDVVC